MNKYRVSDPMWYIFLSDQSYIDLFLLNSVTIIYRTFTPILLLIFYPSLHIHSLEKFYLLLTSGEVLIDLVIIWNFVIQFIIDMFFL
jgi:hypothetical protein